MTPYKIIYDAFLAKIEEDEWTDILNMEETEADWREILESAIPYFKFPRIKLDRDDTGFLNDLDSEEIQILATLMKQEWLDRTIMTLENVKPMYAEQDFSQANLLDKFIKLLDQTVEKANSLQRIYYRSIKGEPFDYSKLAGR